MALDQKDEETKDEKDNKDIDKKDDKEEEYNKKIKDLFENLDEENFDMNEFLKTINKYSKDMNKFKYYKRGITSFVVRLLMSMFILFACCGFLSSFIEINKWYNALFYIVGSAIIMNVIGLIARKINFRVDPIIISIALYVLYIVIAIILNIFAPIGFYFSSVFSTIGFYLVYYILSGIMKLLIFKNKIIIKF